MSVLPSTPRVVRPLRLLVAEDSEPDAGLLVRELERHGFAPSWRRVWTADGLVNALRDAPWDLVISDYAMPGFGGLEALALVIESGLDLPFILVSGTIGEDIAVSAMRAGAHDYLLKDHLARLGAAVDRELREAGQRQARRRAETDARAAQSALLLHTNALNAAANAILITDADGHIEWVNPAFCALTGFSAEECLGRDPGDLQRPPVHDPSFYAQMWQTILAGHVWRGELVNCRKDGTTYHEEQTITPVTGAGGRIEHFIGVKQDITPRKRADERIRQQASLLDAVTDPIYVTALDGRAVSWNRSADALYGFSRGESAREGGVVADAAALDAARAAVLAAGTWSGEFPYADAGGRALTLLSRWTLLRDDAGLALGVLRIDTDITERKLLEQQFLRAQRMEAIGALASGIAHDLNNVLAPTLMLTPLLRDALPDADNRGMIDTIEQCAQRGADIVRQLLTFARGEPGARVALPIRHLLRDIDKIVRETFPRSIRVTTRPPDELWTAEGDATQVHQVLLNLCINARDAMPEGGDLVRCLPAGERDGGADRTRRGGTHGARQRRTRAGGGRRAGPAQQPAAHARRGRVSRDRRRARARRARAVHAARGRDPRGPDRHDDARDERRCPARGPARHGCRGPRRRHDRPVRTAGPGR